MVKATMTEQREQSTAASRGWLEKLGRSLAGGPHDYEGLIELLRDAESRGVIDQDAESMLEGVLQVTEMQVREIMIPRAQMVVVERGQSLDELLPVVIESGCSRFPVIGDDRDEVVGILLAKDLLQYYQGDSRRNFNIREILRPPAFIPESKRLNVLLRDFRASRNHMAMVVDEYGGVSGLVTIEDVLEQIVGEIDDEHDIEDEDDILRYSDTRYMVKALTEIDAFNEYFEADFSDDEFDTVGGLVMNSFGRLPRRGESVALGRFRFTVLRADNRRIHLLRLQLLSPSEVAGEDEDPDEEATSSPAAKSTRRDGSEAGSGKSS